MIVAHFRNDTLIEAINKLIWKHNKNGRVTLKSIYQHLTSQQNLPDDHLGGKILALSELQPKIRAFLWRISHSALPTLYELCRRTKRGLSTCPRCQQENETINHMLYTCTIPRIVWFRSPLGLRTDGMHMQPLPALEWALQHLQKQDFLLFANLAWALWKSRNSFIFQGKTEHPNSILAEGLALTQLTATQLKNTVTHTSYGSRGNTSAEARVQIKENFKAVVTLDGSWDTEGKSGIAAAFFCNTGNLQHIVAKPAQAERGSLSAEVHALHLALTTLKEMHVAGPVMMCSDCQNLVEYFNHHEDQFIQDWHAIPKLLECVQLIGDWGGMIHLRHFSRQYNAILHKLANYARGSQRIPQGYPSSQILGHLDLDQKLPASYFSF